MPSGTGIESSAIFMDASGYWQLWRLNGQVPSLNEIHVSESPYRLRRACGRSGTTNTCVCVFPPLKKPSVSVLPLKMTAIAWLRANAVTQFVDGSLPSLHEANRAWKVLSPVSKYRPGWCSPPLRQRRLPWRLPWAAFRKVRFSWHRHPSLPNRWNWFAMSNDRSEKGAKMITQFCRVCETAHAISLRLHGISSGRQWISGPRRKTAFRARVGSGISASCKPSQPYL